MLEKVWPRKKSLICHNLSVFHGEINIWPTSSFTFVPWSFKCRPRVQNYEEERWGALTVRSSRLHQSWPTLKFRLLSSRLFQNWEVTLTISHPKRVPRTVRWQGGTAVDTTAGGMVPGVPPKLPFDVYRSAISDLLKTQVSGKTRSLQRMIIMYKPLVVISHCISDGCIHGLGQIL